MACSRPWRALEAALRLIGQFFCRDNSLNSCLSIVTALFLEDGNRQNCYCKGLYLLAVPLLLDSACKLTHQDMLHDYYMLVEA